MATIISEQDYIKRIAALERQCATPAAQVDRQADVVRVAQAWHSNDKGFTRIALHNAVSHYNTAMAQLTKGNVTPVRLTEDYYVLAEIRLAADLTIVEYGSCATRLYGIADLIDKKRPELKPTYLTKDGG